MRANYSESGVVQLPTFFVILFVVAIVLPVLFVLVVRWVVAPLLIRSRNTLAARVELEPVLAERLSPEMREHVGGVVRQFRDESFEVVANYSIGATMPGVFITQALLVNRATGDVGVAIMSWTELSRTLVVAIRSEFADGTMLTTGTNRDVGVFPPDPLHDGVTFSRALDVATLAEVHRRQLRKAGKDSAPRVTPAYFGASGRARNSGTGQGPASRL